MAIAKKKSKIQASEVQVGNKTLERVLTELAEQVKANDARLARVEERPARVDEWPARIDERSAQLDERSARAEEKARIALQIIAEASQETRAILQEIRASNARADARFGALEKAGA
jgi:hypothetical protein